MLNRDRLVRGSRFVVRAALVANRFLLIAFVVGLVLSWIFPVQFVTLILQPNPGVAVPSALTGMRLLIVIGIVMSVAADRLFAALSEVIASASAGDPFIIANARRLQTIGWSLLVLQLLDIPGGLLGRFYPSMGSAAPSGTFDIGGWISVLMVFVLSRVFAAGSAMRDELEGTV
jgi:Protein of unknown function (DUF2975)